MRIYALILIALFCCSCARTNFVKAPEIFRPLPVGSTLEQRQSYFEKQRVHIVGANEGLIGGQSYNATELLRYYDDARNGDASALQTQACAKVPRAEDWWFFSTAYGSIAGALIGGIGAFLATKNYDFNALNAVPGGALPGLGWGMLAGSAVGISAFGVVRYSGKNLAQQAAGEFNHTTRSLLKLEAAPQIGGAKAGLFYEY